MAATKNFYSGLSVSVNAGIITGLRFVIQMGGPNGMGIFGKGRTRVFGLERGYP